MKRFALFSLGLVLLAALLLAGITLIIQIRERPADNENSNSETVFVRQTVMLPDPDLEGLLPLEQAINQRRSVRSYSQKELSLAAISQILWSAQGITDQARGLRTVPSAGALYPLEIYLAAGKVNGLNSGIYLYNPQQNQLHEVQSGDRRSELYTAALSQRPVLDAPASIIIAGVYQRTQTKYGDRAEKYVHIEAGHAGQNICLQVISLDLTTVPIGAFHDQEIKKLIGMPEEETPLYIFPIGYPAE